MRIHVAITTYNRPDLVRALVKQCVEMLGPKDRIFVYNDGSDRRPDIDSRATLVNLQHHGKQRYWAVINRMFADIRDNKADYYFMLPDDDVLCPDYFQKAIKIYNEIGHPNKVCLSTHVQDHRKGKPCWNDLPQRLFDINGVKVWDCGYMDMRVVAERKFFEYLSFRIKPIKRSRWANNPLLGSGVGQQITQRLQPMKMYMLDEGLIRERDREDSPSVMNLGAEKLRP